VCPVIFSGLFCRRMLCDWDLCRADPCQSCRWANDREWQSRPIVSQATTVIHQAYGSIFVSRTERSIWGLLIYKGHDGWNSFKYNVPHYNLAKGYRGLPHRECLIQRAAKFRSLRSLLRWRSHSHRNTTRHTPLYTWQSFSQRARDHA